MSIEAKVLGTPAGTPWIGDMKASSVTAIHAGYAGNNATLAFPGPFTQPTQPRLLTVTFNAAWDGGTVTVTGTDINGRVLTEVFTPGAGTTVVGTKLFATVVSAAKSLVGASATTASIGNSYVVGAPSNIEGHALIGYQFSWTNAASPIGVVSFDVSNTYDPNRPDWFAYGVTWKNVAAPSTFVHPNASVAGEICSLQDIPWKWIRPRYTQTSGGTADRLSCDIQGKRR